MSKFMRKKQSPLTVSRRSIFLLRQFGKGEHLDLPDNCVMEFPDAKRDDTGGSCAEKYKRFVVNYTPEAGYYAGGVFRFEFDVRDVPDYPEKPPKVTCLTKVWHPNISLDGRVCHNYLQANEAYGSGCGYTSALGLTHLVLAVITMFDISKDHHSDSFNPADPLNPEAAQQFTKDERSFERTVRQYVKDYAKPVDIPPWCLAQE